MYVKRSDDGVLLSETLLCHYAARGGGAAAWKPGGLACQHAGTSVDIVGVVAWVP
jgi:hypothetical protein